MVAIPPIPDTTGVVSGDRSTAGMRQKRSLESQTDSKAGKRVLLTGFVVGS
jgi:hypothetical protein